MAIKIQDHGHVATGGQLDSIPGSPSPLNFIHKIHGNEKVTKGEGEPGNEASYPLTAILLMKELALVYVRTLTVW